MNLFNLKRGFCEILMEAGHKRPVIKASCMFESLTTAMNGNGKCGIFAA